MSSAITVTSDSYTLSNTRFYHGNADSINSGKGFKVYISGLTDGYDRLRLIRIHYPSKDTTPTITIATEIEIDPTVDNVTILDVGKTLGELTVDEFNIASTGIFTCEDLAVKDNILFAGNITEEFFDIPDDFDCRAVRFNANGVADLYDASYDYITLNNVNADTWRTSFPKDHDAINLTNNPIHDKASNGLGNFKYQKSYPNRHGAEGPNILIGFTIEQMTIDQSSKAYSTFTNSGSSNPVNSYSNYANPITAGQPCWQRDEVYRLYIVFFNNRGQRSFPKWICDLRMPGYFENFRDYNGILKSAALVARKSSTPDTIQGYLLYPVVTLKNMPEGAVSAQV
jgi:hypothetical protein